MSLDCNPTANEELIAGADLRSARVCRGPCEEQKGFGGEKAAARAPCVYTFILFHILFWLTTIYRDSRRAREAFPDKIR